MRVEATQPGFYGRLYKPGERFELRHESQFSDKWMKRVDSTPVEDSNEQANSVPEATQTKVTKKKRRGRPPKNPPSE